MSAASVRVAGVMGAASLSVAGCATLPRVYSDQELLDVGRTCGLAPGSLLQDESEPRLLIMFATQVSPTRQACVKRWSRKRSLTLALVEIEEEKTQ